MTIVSKLLQVIWPWKSQCNQWLAAASSWEAVRLMECHCSVSRHSLSQPSFLFLFKNQVQVTMICLFSLSLAIYLCIYLSMYLSSMTMSSGVLLAALCFCGRKGDVLVCTWPASEWTLPPMDPRTVRQTLNHSLQLCFWFHVDLSFLVIAPPEKM